MSPAATTSTPRQEEILRAAMKLLREGGLARLTTRKIAERIGFTEGAFFRHFPSKQALLLRLMDRLKEMLLVPIREIAADATLPIETRLRRIIRHHIRLVREQDSLPILLLAEASATGDEALLERMRALIKEYRLLLQDLIRQGQREGSLTNEVTPECLSLGLIGLPAIVAIQHRLQPDPPLEDRLEKDFVQWVIGQLGRNSQT